MEFQDIIERRYACRRYRGDQVEEWKLDRILAAANRAPSAKNRQSPRIYVLRSAQALDTLDTLTHCRYGASMVLLFAYDAGEEWHNPTGSGARSGVEDASIAATFAMLEATELGLATCWCNSFDNADLERRFGLPERERSVLIMPVGYAANEATPAPTHAVRKPLAEMVRTL